MIVLGIDPGSRQAGYALIEAQGRKMKYLFSGTLRYDCDTQFLERLGVIYQSCNDLITQYAPDEVALESLIYVKSVSALSKLAQARGAMIAAFMKTHPGRVFEYSPNLVKVSVSGDGHAGKEAVQKSLSLMFGSISYRAHDESDALAVAVCHALHVKSRKIYNSQKSSDKGVHL